MRRAGIAWRGTSFLSPTIHLAREKGSAALYRDTRAVRFAARLSGLAAAAAAMAAPLPAQAHAFAERHDLPLPLGFYLAGAGLAVALSFLGSFLLMRPGWRPALHIDIPVPPVLARAASGLIRTVALALLAAVMVIGAAGPISPTQNFATVFVWVIWWVGFALFTALVVDLWSTGNPFRTLIEGILRATGLGQRERSLPAATGWLAVTGLLSIAWLELVSDWSENPRALVLLVAVYAALLLAGAALAGPRSWFETADPLTRLFGLLGHAAPIAARPGGVRLRLPASGLTGMPVSAAGAVFILCLIAIVLFDGLSETPFWAAILDWITRSQTLAGVDILKLIRTIGLLTMALVAVLLYLGLTLAMWRAVRGAQPPGRIFTGFAASLLPIAVAYHLAHYASYMALAAQLMKPIVSDPLGLGWDLFGTANQRINLGVISAKGVWWIAAAALVTGHALSVFVAHGEAQRLFPDHRQAVRSQLPMMVFMVGLTSLSLWILAQPLIE